jgi:transposase
MLETRPDVNTLPTIWHVPDALWAMMNKVLALYDPPKPTGRPRVDQRRALDGIIYRMRTGCQWNHLPEEFGDDVSVYRTFRRWEALGIFDILWALLISKCEELGGVDWQWQAADGCLGKARGVPKKGRPRSVSAPTLRTVPKQASRKACLSKEKADRLLLSSLEPISTT